MEQKKPSPAHQFFWMMACFIMISPIFLMFVFVLKLKLLTCIDTTNKMYMLLGFSFFYAYIIKNYFDFAWRK
jgi:hypothetical protein